MFEFLGKILIGAVISAIILIAFETGNGGGGIIRPGSQKDKDIDKRVKEKLSKGSTSSKEELQEWWDTYHPPK